MKNIFYRFLFCALLILASCEGIGKIKAREVETAKPIIGEIRESFSEPAKTRLSRTWTVAMPIAGRISRIALEPGDRMNSGEKIADFDLVPFRHSVQEAEAAIRELQGQIAVNEYDKLEQTALKEIQAAIQAAQEALKAADAQIDSEKARAERAEKELNRQEDLIKTGAISQSELEDYVLEAETTLIELRKQEFVRAALNAIFTAYNLGPQFVHEWLGRKSLERDVLLHQLAQAKVRLERAQYELDLASIRSPVDGIALERYEQGDTLLPAGQRLLLIGNLSDLEVEADVLTQDALRIKPGTSVTLQPSSQLESFSGKVKRIEPAGFTKLSSLGVEQQRVRVIISLDRIPDNLGVGYRLQARFLTASKKDALIAPRFSVLQSQDGEFYVLKIENGVLKKQIVKLGLKSDLELEITEGLSKDDVIVRAPDASMKQGDKVNAKQ
ncbi:HlyD family efflux transporter periplasmic adaptor subunit [Candidatus Sumerlaeota bacterium]|nr:HlyD family efflux transporter periplasmic adaptor subunit [Candidatus Sumerlaeota bacterium]